MSTDKELILSVKDLRQHFPIDGGGIFKKTVGYVRAVDGISGRCETSVDGFCAAALEKKIAELDALSKKYAALRAAGN